MYEKVASLKCLSANYSWTNESTRLKNNAPPGDHNPWAHVPDLHLQTKRTQGKQILMGNQLDKWTTNTCKAWLRRFQAGQYHINYS